MTVPYQEMENGHAKERSVFAATPVPSPGLLCLCTLSPTKPHHHNLAMVLRAPVYSTPFPVGAFPQSTLHATRCYTVAWLACSLFAMVLTALLYVYMTPQRVLDLQKKVQRLRHESFPPRGFVHAVNPPFNTCRNVSVSLYTCSVRSPQRFNIDTPMYSQHR